MGRARHIQAELEALTADVAALRDEVSGTVRLGCIGTSARWLVPARARERHPRAHPKVHVIVVDATTTSLVPRLLADELDLAVVNLPITHPDVVAEHLFDEDRILIAPDGHPLADARPGVARRPGRPRAAPRAAGHRVPRRARPRGHGRGRHRAAGQGRGRRAPPDRHARLPGVRRRHRAGHRGPRLARGQLATGRQSTAWPAGRSGWRGASGACCRRRPGRCTPPSSRWWRPTARASTASTGSTT